ncbi:energy transducer TonB [Paraglaciecola chathamensis]|uniref:energy transducer TonB n=1 Tax=Paraglaciecola chathamensis TaxID=368405 RepID=UPI0026F718E9|nr:energy transducer TonB [Paraglaciecola chathamensis]MDO6837968.1 energy transducer TonB [Paraglaciecola chathamensis]
MIIPAKLLIVSSASLIASYALAANDTPSQADANAHPTAVSEPSTVLLESAKLAKPIKRVAANYPIRMARKGAEGWVQLNFVVGTDGSVNNIVVVDSSGMEDFENAAVRALKSWEYSPTYVDGKPIEQCHNDIQIDFRLDGGQRGVRRKFKRNYQSVREALDSNDIALAHDLTASMKGKGLLNSIEFTYYSLLRADLAKAQNDEVSELQYVERILNTDKKGEYVGSEAYRMLLNRLFVLQLKQAQYLDALDTFQRVETQENNEDNIALLNPYVTKILDLLESDQVISIPGEVKQDGDWWHGLSRNSFSLSNVSGTLNTVELRCHNKRELYTATTDSTWNIPESWGRCSVRVVGDTNSQFTLLEIPKHSKQS